MLGWVLPDGWVKPLAALPSLETDATPTSPARAHAASPVGSAQPRQPL